MGHSGVQEGPQHGAPPAPPGARSPPSPCASPPAPPSLPFPPPRRHRPGRGARPGPARLGAAPPRGADRGGRRPPGADKRRRGRSSAPAARLRAAPHRCRRRPPPSPFSPFSPSSLSPPPPPMVLPGPPGMSRSEEVHRLTENVYKVSPGNRCRPGAAAGCRAPLPFIWGLILFFKNFFLILPPPAPIFSAGSGGRAGCGGREEVPPGAAAAPAPCRGMRSGWRCGGGDRSPGRERAAAGGPGAPQRGTAPSPPRCCGGARGARECAWELVSSHGRAVLSPNHLDPGRVCGGCSLSCRD